MHTGVGGGAETPPSSSLLPLSREGWISYGLIGREIISDAIRADAAATSSNHRKSSTSHRTSPLLSLSLSPSIYLYLSLSLWLFFSFFASLFFSFAYLSFFCISFFFPPPPLSRWIEVTKLTIEETKLSIRVIAVHLPISWRLLSHFTSIRCICAIHSIWLKHLFDRSKNDLVITFHDARALYGSRRCVSFMWVIRSAEVYNRRRKRFKALMRFEARATLRIRRFS